MRTCLQYCKNCGDRYSWQASGYRCNDEYNHDKYCPVCRKAMLDAFDLITKKSKIIWIETDEVDLNTLLKWEQDYYDQLKKERLEKQEKGEFTFPIGRRISPSLFDLKTGESQINGFVNGMDDKKGRYYHYAYWPSEKEQNKARITVNVRISIIENEIGEILEYLNE